MYAGCQRHTGRRVIVLKAGGNPNDGGFDVGGDGDELPLVVTIADQSIESADASDCQRGGATHTGAGRSLTIRYQMKAGCGFEEVNQLGNQFEPLFANEIFHGGEFGLKSDFTVSRLEHNAAVVARVDLAMRAQRGGKI